MAKDEIRRDSLERSLRFKKERRFPKVLIDPAAFMDMRGRDPAKNELLGSIRDLLKDGRSKGAHIGDVLIL